MTKVLHICWREFRDTVFTWAFVLSLLSLPAGGALMMLLIPLMEATDAKMFRSDSVGEIMVVEAAGQTLLDAMILEADGDRNLKDLTLLGATGDPQPHLDRLRAGELLGVIAPAEEPMGPKRSGQIAYLSPELQLENQRDVRDLVADAESRIRIVAHGLEPSEVRALTRTHRPEMVVFSKGDQEDGSSTQEHAIREAAAMVLPVLGLGLLWLGTFVSAQFLLQNSMEERSSKVIEVLLSAVSPMQLLAGKIIGLGLVGALLTGVYGGSLLAVLLVASMTDLVSIWGLLLFGLYYIQAYLVMGSIFAAIGSVVNDVREAQSLMTPAVMLVTIPMLLVLPMAADPNGTIGVALSWTPLLTPFAMCFRVLASDLPAWWEVLGTLVWGYAWSLACLWGAARVFRIGVLMQGKAPTFRELATWIFQR